MYAWECEKCDMSETEGYHRVGVQFCLFNSIYIYSIRHACANYSFCLSLSSSLSLFLPLSVSISGLLSPTTNPLTVRTQRAEGKNATTEK